VQRNPAKECLKRQGNQHRRLSQVRALALLGEERPTIQNNMMIKNIELNKGSITIFFSNGNKT